MPCSVDIPERSAPFWSEMEEEWLWGREEVEKRTEKSGEKENCNVMYERKNKWKEGGGKKERKDDRER